MKTLNDFLHEAKDTREYNYEGDMVLSQINQIMHHLGEMKSMLKPNTNIPEWVQSKITLATDYIQTAADYMTGESMKEEVELDEAAAEDKHFKKQSPKMQDAINLHLRRGLDYLSAVKSARKHIKEDIAPIENNSQNVKKGN
jgi:hypothetical protein